MNIENRQADPERSIEWGKARPRPTLGVHRELLPESELDDRLFLSTSGEGAEAAEARDQQDEQRPHGGGMLLDFVAQNESESRNRSGVSSEDGLAGRGGKPEQQQSGRILRTDTRVQNVVRRSRAENLSNINVDEY